MRKAATRRFLSLAVFVCYGISLFLTCNALAASNIFTIESAEITELTETAEGNVSVVDNSSISSNIVFKSLGDEAKLKITLKNSDDKERVIEAITDDNNNSHFIYQYDSYENLRVKAGETFDFIVTIKYQNSFTNASDRNQNTNVKFAIKYFDVSEPDVIPVVPNTGGNIVAKNEAAIKSHLIILIISAVGIIIFAVTTARKHKKSVKVIAAFIALFATATITTTVSAETANMNNITISVSYALYDKYIVTYEDGEGNAHEIVVEKNGKANIEDQGKTGYTFLGWEDEDGNSFSLDTKIIKDISIKPVFRKNNYTISFNNNEGDGTMSDLPMVYDEEKALTKNTFTRSGFSFKGWNTKADGEGDSYTDEQSVKNLVATDGGNVVLYAMWGPVVYDITSDAVKNYYASVNSWLSDEDTFLIAMKDNYDSHACKSTSLSPQTSEDFPDDYRYAKNGTVYCDKPKGYNTGVTGTIKVYLSDENTMAVGGEATYLSINNGVIINMIPGVTYYWENADDTSINGYVKAVGDRRLIDLPVARNVRDLGGIKGADDKIIQYGRIMRGEKLGSGRDVTALNNLGINKEYDVRSDGNNGAHLREGYEVHGMMNYDIIEDNYEGARAALESLMTDIVAGNNVYIHCTHGSDRTGTLIYLAEALLGVSDEDRDRDFDLTALSGRADRTRFYDHMSQSSSGFNPTRKYVYMKNELPDEGTVREWYLQGSTDRAADEQLIENFRNAILI